MDPELRRQLDALVNLALFYLEAGRSDENDRGVREALAELGERLSVLEGQPEQYYTYIRDTLAGRLTAGLPDHAHRCGVFVEVQDFGIRLLTRLDTIDANFEGGKCALLLQLIDTDFSVHLFQHIRSQHIETAMGEKRRMFYVEEGGRDRNYMHTKMQAVINEEGGNLAKFCTKITGLKTVVTTLTTFALSRIHLGPRLRYIDRTRRAFICVGDSVDADTLALRSNFVGGAALLQREQTASKIVLTQRGAGMAADGFSLTTRRMWSALRYQLVGEAQQSRATSFTHFGIMAARIVFPDFSEHTMLCSAANFSMSTGNYCLSGTTLDTVDTLAELSNDFSGTKDIHTEQFCLYYLNMWLARHVRRVPSGQRVRVFIHFVTELAICDACSSAIGYTITFLREFGVDVILSDSEVANDSSRGDLWD